jgi:AcrR family transcriptional regulator
MGRRLAEARVLYTLPRERKPRTRARLIRQMIAVAAAQGYEKTSIRNVVAGTGIGRSTFYEHFTDKDRCFEEALGVAAEVLDLRLRAHGPANLAALITTVVRFAGENEDVARVLFVESLAAGAAGGELRAGAIGRLETQIVAALARERQIAAPLGLPPATLAGVLFRLLAIRLGRPDPDLDALGEGLAGWVEGYRWPAERSPRTGTAGAPELASVPRLALAPRRAASHLSEGAEPSHPRERVLTGLVRAAYENGYSAAAVATITDAARVSRKSFYRQFASRREAALAATERIFQAGMAACAGGFFGPGSWPERAWDGGLALLSFLAANPKDAYFGFIETPRIGPRGAQLAYERLSAFTLFLEDGYRLHPGANERSRVSSEAIMAAMFEEAYGELRARRTATGLLRQLPRLCYVILAPFTGPEEAVRFVTVQSEAVAASS